MKRALIIATGIVLGLILISFIFIKLAFGPLHSSITINLDKEGELICNEIYNGDFAGEFYEVTMVLKTLSGGQYDIGSSTFHHQDWKEQIEVRRVGDWIVIPLDSENFVQIKILNTVNGQLNDTTLLPFDLRKDRLYKEKFNDHPNHLYQGNSRIIEISGNSIEVDYEYEMEAGYPSGIRVSQRVVYEVNMVQGKLVTKEVRDRVVQ